MSKDIQCRTPGCKSLGKSVHDGYCSDDCADGRAQWLAGYEAARKQAADVTFAENTCGCKGFCECYGAATLDHIEEQIRTMQPEKP